MVVSRPTRMGNIVNGKYNRIAQGQNREFLGNIIVLHGCFQQELVDAGEQQVGVYRFGCFLLFGHNAVGLYLVDRKIGKIAVYRCGGKLSFRNLCGLV